jgi:hypothetical protein
LFYLSGILHGRFVCITFSPHNSLLCLLSLCVWESVWLDQMFCFQDCWDLM